MRPGSNQGIQSGLELEAKKKKKPREKNIKYLEVQPDRILDKWRLCIPTLWHHQPATPAFNGIQRISSLFRFKKILERMYCDCYHSREMQYKWSPLALKTVWSPREPWLHFAQPVLLSLVWVFLLKQVVKPKQSRFDICLHVDILFCHVSPPQRKEMFNLSTAHVFWTTVSCDVALGRCFISFRHCGTLWHKHLHLRRQSVAQEISPWFTFCCSPAPSPSPLPFVSAQLFLSASGAKNGAFFQCGITKRSLFEPQAHFFAVCIRSPSLPSVLFFLKKICQSKAKRNALHVFPVCFRL